MSAGLHDAYSLQQDQQRRPQLAAPRHTKIDIIDSEQAQILIAGLLCILVRAVDLGKSSSSLNEAKLGGYEDVVSLAGAFEPFADELLAVAVETGISAQRTILSGTSYTYSELSQCVQPSSWARSRMANLSSSFGIGP